MLRLLSSKFRKACDSFDGSTLVSTEFGLREIQKIHIGDYVWAYNEETKEKSLQEVVHLIRGEGVKELVDIQLASGDVITATVGHPFYLPTMKEGQRWKDAGKLTIDDVLLSITDSKVLITNVYEYEELARVYNLTVANDHTYYVGRSGVLGHNAEGCKFPVFSSSARNHILRGEISAGGRITGYHHRFAGMDSGNINLLEVTRKGRGSKGGKGSVYEAWVGYTDSNGVLHRKLSTFFPNNWTSGRVIAEINSAVLRAVTKGKLNGTVRAKSASGIEIEMKISGGVLNTAYPILR